MAEGLGSAELRLTVDDSTFASGLKAAEQKAQQSGQRIQQSLNRSAAGLQPPPLPKDFFKIDASDLAGASGAAGQLGGALAAVGPAAAAGAAAVAAFTVAAAAVAVPAIQAAGAIQRQNAAFEGLTGSAEAAAKLRQQLFDLSKTTPFRNEEILQTAQRFLAVGIQVDKLNGSINRIGTLAAQSGQSLERIGLIYAQVFAKGRLQGEENLQFLEAGIDLSDELSIVTGRSGKALQDAMSKGQISIQDVNRAIVLATGNMTALQKAGQAVDVQFSNIGDNIGVLFGGFATAVAPALAAGAKVINRVFEEAFPDIGSIEKAFKPLTDAATEFANLLEKNPELVTQLATALRVAAESGAKMIAFWLNAASDILASTDVQLLVDGFRAVEVQIRSGVKSALALTTLLSKTGQLVGRALTNPIQFSKDIANAGGLQKFLTKEYEDGIALWNSFINTKPLEFPKIKPPDAGAGAPDGDLDQKARDTEQAARAIQAAQASAAQLTQASQTRLNAVQRTIGLEGEALQIAQQQLAVEEAKAIERQKFNAYNDAFKQANGDGNNEAVIRAAAEYEDAANNVRIALISGAQTAKDSLLQAANRLESALRSPSLFALQDPATQQREIDKAYANVNQALREGLIARLPSFEATSRVRAGFGIETQLTQKGAQDLFALSNEINQLRSATSDNTQAMRQSARLSEPPPGSVKDPNFTPVSDRSINNLAERISGLESKDWGVFVTVNADAGSVIVDGDATNRNF